MKEIISQLRGKISETTKAAIDNATEKKDEYSDKLIKNAVDSAISAIEIAAERIQGKPELNRLKATKALISARVRIGIISLNIDIEIPVQKNR